MNETLDPSTVLLALATIAVFGAFFWYVAHRFWTDGRRLSDWLDGASQRKRDRIEREAREAPQPAWKRAAGRLAQVALVAALLALAWLRLRGA